VIPFSSAPTASRTHLTKMVNSSASGGCRNFAGTSAILSPREILAQIFSAVEDFSRGREQHDDMAAALFHYSG
jgi:hypothetical protein